MKTKFQKLKTASKFLIFSAFIAQSIACGPSVKIASKAREAKLSVLALLPVQAPETVIPERLSYVSNLLSAELKNTGFIMVDNAVVRKVCKKKGCPERKAIPSIDGIVELKIASTSEHSFGLGFSNSLEGSLKIISRNGEKLVEVKHTERRRGGVIFDSGQVIQGIQDQLENSGDMGFKILADKFTASVVQSLPKSLVSEVSSNALNPPRIDKALVTRLAEDDYKICIEGTPSNLAYLKFRRERSNLREGQGGKYCGAFTLEKEANSMPLFVELRSQFGVAVSKMIDLVAGSLNFKNSNSTAKVVEK